MRLTLGMLNIECTAVGKLSRLAKPGDTEGPPNNFSIAFMLWFLHSFLQIFLLFSFREKSHFLIPDCFRRARQGFKLYYVIVRDSIEARDVEECALFCRNQAFCRTFAFR